VDDVTDICLNENDIEMKNDSDKLSKLRKELSIHIEDLQRKLFSLDNEIEEVSKDLIGLRDSSTKVKSEDEKHAIVQKLLTKDTERNNFIYSKKLYKIEIETLQNILRTTF